MKKDYRPLPSNRRHGMTLIEMLVSMAIGLVIFGLVLGIYLRMNATTAQALANETMWMEGRSIVQAIDQALRSRVAPSELDLAAGIPGESLTADEATFLVSDATYGADIWRVTIANREIDIEEGKQWRVVIRRELMQAVGADPVGSESVLGLYKEKTATRVRFFHAYGFASEFEPDWTRETRPGVAPRLIQYVVSVKDEKDALMPLTFTGAVALNN